MKVSAATVEVWDTRWHPSSPRVVTYLAADPYRGSWRAASGGELVAVLELREDGWLEVDHQGYANGDLDLIPPRAILALRVSKPEPPASS